MGYYSNFNGDFTPMRALSDYEKDRIYSWFKAKFGVYTFDNGNVVFPPKEKGVYYGSIIFDPDDGRVLPTMGTMKGYDFGFELTEFVSYLKKLGIEYTGFVERVGETDDDIEEFTIEKYDVVQRLIETDCGPIEMAKRLDRIKTILLDTEMCAENMISEIGQIVFKDDKQD